VCEKLDSLLSEGGCAGVIVNTVARAQQMAAILAEHFDADKVRLLHSGFISLDRTEKEAELLRWLGPPDSAQRPDKLIVVGTQVIEQSLDIDFDVLFTDLCPIDLLIQRLGRLFRHFRAARPAKLTNPKCFVMGCDTLDKGSVAVYGEYVLMTTKYLLADSICLPEDIARLVGAAYGDDEVVKIPESEQGAYKNAKTAEQKRKNDKETRASKFQLRGPTKGRDDLTGALDADAPKKEGEATVRDGEMSIEIILLQRVGLNYRLLPWIDDGKILPTNTAPNQDTAFTLAGCKIRLPWMLSKKWEVHKTITKLEEKGRNLQRIWKDSPWLNGELLLVLDEDLEAELNGVNMRYDRDFGLVAVSGSI
jgi:CRISPR-associated endonuclease/helicase Cas3